MNNDIFKGRWNQLKGKVKEKWGKLTDDDITFINGKRDILLGRLQERYGWEQKRAEDALKEFEKALKESKIEQYERGYFQKEDREEEDRQRKAK